MTTPTKSDVERAALGSRAASSAPGVLQAPPFGRRQRVGCVSSIDDNALCIS